ncbi:hypothetical protein KIPB_017380, partial [Kipferlia bialata]|eukprot:g17380.t1
MASAEDEHKAQLHQLTSSLE